MFGRVPITSQITFININKLRMLINFNFNAFNKIFCYYDLNVRGEKKKEIKRLFLKKK